MSTSTLHTVCQDGNSDDIRRLKPTAEMLLQRNDDQQTPLAVAIIGGSLQNIETLLEVGASKTIFVKGYSDGSLVCTLPQASQPPSSVFHHQPPHKSTDDIVISKIDEALCTQIKHLRDEKIAAAAAAAAALVASSTSRSPASGGSATSSPVFNPLPDHLKV